MKVKAVTTPLVQNEQNGFVAWAFFCERSAIGGCQTLVAEMYLSSLEKTRAEEIRESGTIVEDNEYTTPCVYP